jgi:hypothetical protein
MSVARANCIGLISPDAFPLGDGLHERRWRSAQTARRPPGVPVDGRRLRGSRPLQSCISHSGRPFSFCSDAGRPATATLRPPPWSSAGELRQSLRCSSPSRPKSHTDSPMHMRKWHTYAGRPDCQTPLPPSIAILPRVRGASRAPAVVFIRTPQASVSLSPKPDTSKPASRLTMITSPRSQSASPSSDGRTAG